jgi:hypothetical protein
MEYAYLGVKIKEDAGEQWQRRDRTGSDIGGLEEEEK